MLLGNFVFLTLQCVIDFMVHTDPRITDTHRHAPTDYDRGCENQQPQKSSCITEISLTLTDIYPPACSQKTFVLLEYVVCERIQGLWIGLSSKKPILQPSRSCYKLPVFRCNEAPL